MVIRAIDSEDMSANMEYSNDQISEILEMWKSDFERLLQNWSEKWKSKREQPEEPKEAAAPNHLYMEKTSSHQPTKVFDEMPESTLQSNYSDFLRTLVVTVHEASYPVTTETLHQIFDKYGLVEEIDILPSVGNFQALVRYKSMENSISARYSLHNRCMYEGCCWLDIKYLSYTFLEEVLGRHNWVEQIWSESETKLKVMYAAVKKVKVPCKLEPRPVNTLVSSIMRRESSVDVGVVYSIGEFEESSGDNFPNKTVTKELRELATEKLGSIGYVEILKEDQPVENQQLTIERASHISEWSIKEDEIDRDYDNAFLDHKSELIHILFDPGGGSGGKNEALEISGNDLTEHSMCGKPNSIIGQDGITQPIKTVVVLVLENRSFDHMLGWMKKSVNPSINGVTEKECNSVSKPSSDGLPQKICFSDDAEYVDPDPGHSFEAVEQQVFGSSSIPSMSGFVEQALSMSENLSETVMKGFKPQNVPIYATLVSEFAVFDRWFSSIPGPTQPSRLFVYSATSHGSTSHVKKQLATGCPQQTIFDSLHENGLDFGVYFQNIPTTLFYRNMRKLKYIFKFHQYDLKFKKDARKGKLPSLTVIEPRYFDLKGLPANDDHPSHDVANGQKMVKEVYETLRASPQWNETLLVITYDEHGGFYDHVQTPYVNVPNPDGNTGPAPYFFKFDRLGVRVPTIMVSPWIKKGTVISKPRGPTPDSEFEHSSIPATIKKIFNLSSNFLTHRDAWAGTFEQVFGGLNSPRTDCPEVLPDVAPLRRTETNENRGLSEFQGEVVQLAAVLNGDHFLSSFQEEIGNKMNVKEAHEYVKGAVSRFIRASKQAIKLGADQSAIVDMRSSLTTRSSIHN